ARAVPGHIGWTIEGVAVDPCAGIARAATAAAPAGFRRRATSSCIRNAGRHARTRANADVLALPAEHQKEAAVGIEFHHRVRPRVDNPDVVLRIHTYLLRKIDRVDALSDFLDELAVLIELKESRSAVIKRALVAERRHGVTRSRVHENVA